MSEPAVELNCETGQITVRPPTDEQLADAAAREAAATAADAATQTLLQNRGTLADRATAAINNLKAAADALDAGTATAAQQRAALALCCRTTARLARLVLDELDTAD